MRSQEPFHKGGANEASRNFAILEYLPTPSWIGRRPPLPYLSLLRDDAPRPALP